MDTAAFERWRTAPGRAPTRGTCEASCTNSGVARRPTSRRLGYFLSFFPTDGGASVGQWLRGSPKMLYLDLFRIQEIGAFGVWRILKN